MPPLMGASFYHFSPNKYIHVNVSSVRPGELGQFCIARDVAEIGV